MQEGEYFRAITEYRRFLFYYPDEPRRAMVHFRIGLALYHGESYGEALQTFREVTQHYPNTAYGKQAWLWQGALAKYGDPEIACLWVARPGTSAHQSGRAIDCHLGDPIESEYADGMRTHPTYRWLVTHAARFGFFTYDLEPWHWEYNPRWR